ncbi:uncharacterized protein A4U43_C03F12140 [Asparagus officinalis]|uniref:RING-type E3 ubiquitin transferase n=1 Tax=Asparagus officinalis TaxID=4686 RepID=A0A5P1FC58_ASPOF|nr:uncharacterized protein A4U43_C03F12140 [Asparagus officinalis]
MRESSGDGGSGTSSSAVSRRRRSEIMRAAEKDDHYAAYVHDACRDAFRHLFGTRVAVAYQSEVKLLGQTFYYLLTTGSGQQTLGEEYCDISQVASSYGLPPTPARRVLFIVYQTAIPYLAERISSRMTSRSIILADSQFDELHGSNYPGRNPAESSITAESSSTNVRRSPISRFRVRLYGFWLSAVRKWPSVLPFARELMQLALRANLMFFYFEGRGLPILNEDGDLIIGSNLSKGSWTSESSAASEVSRATSKCTLCLSTRQHPTATPCGHVFCWAKKLNAVNRIIMFAGTALWNGVMRSLNALSAELPSHIQV